MNETLLMYFLFCAAVGVVVGLSVAAVAVWLGRKHL